MDGNFPSILVTGSRQSGKSTVLQYLATKKKQVLHEVSLDDLTERTHALEDPESFLRTHGVPLIIDEFQYAPNLLSYIKNIIVFFYYLPLFRYFLNCLKNIKIETLRI